MSKSSFVSSAPHQALHFKFRPGELPCWSHALSFNDLRKYETRALKCVYVPTGSAAAHLKSCSVALWLHLRRTNSMFFVIVSSRVVISNLTPHPIFIRDRELPRKLADRDLSHEWTHSKIAPGEHRRCYWPDSELGAFELGVTSSQTRQLHWSGPCPDILSGSRQRASFSSPAPKAEEAKVFELEVAGVLCRITSEGTVRPDEETQRQFAPVWRCRISRGKSPIPGCPVVSVEGATLLVSHSPTATQVLRIHPVWEVRNSTASPLLIKKSPDPDFFVVPPGEALPYCTEVPLSDGQAAGAGKHHS